MNRKFITRLAPLVAIAAFVAVPAAAQAEPHFYKSGVIIPENEPTSTISWGTLTLTPEPAEAGAPTVCENAAGGFVENPTGGGAGVGTTQDFASWSCTNAACPPGNQPPFEKPREFVVASETLPWTLKLIEESGIRTEATGVRVTLGCAVHGLQNGTVNEKPAPGFVGGKEKFYLAKVVVCETEPAEGEKPARRQTPLNVAGKSALVTSTVVFDALAGKLGCGTTEKSDTFQGKTAGKLKTMGYLGSELITTKNP